MLCYAREWAEREDNAIFCVGMIQATENHQYPFSFDIVYPGDSCSWKTITGSRQAPPWSSTHSWIGEVTGRRALPWIRGFACFRQFPIFSPNVDVLLRWCLKPPNPGSMMLREWAKAISVTYLNLIGLFLCLPPPAALYSTQRPIVPRCTTYTYSNYFLLKWLFPPFASKFLESVFLSHIETHREDGPWPSL